MILRRRTMLLGAWVVVAACADRGKVDAGLETTVDTIGDTVRVRTERGAAPVLRLEPDLRIANVEGNEDYELGSVAAIVRGPDGEIYIWDGRLDELRLYDSAGAFVRRLGRHGEGPGEYTDAAGIAPVPNGGVVVWDPQVRRFTVFEPSGAVRASWQWQSSMIFAPHALSTDTANNIYVPALLRTAGSTTASSSQRFAYVRVRPDGGVVDTLMLPAEEPVPMLSARQGNTSTGTALPFADVRGSLITPWGTVGTTQAGRYAIDILRPGGTTLRIERDMEAVAVADAERRDLAEAITRDMRKVDPTWRWSGPEIPRTKPFINGLMFADDERLWVQRSMPGERRPPSDTTRGGRDEWVEPTTYDVFEPDGRLLGEVTVPSRTKVHLALGDRVWAVQRDSLDVPEIVRFRLRRAP